MGKTIASPAYRLTVDIGNTHTVMGLYADEAISQRSRVATRKDTTVDEIAWWLKGMVFAALQQQNVKRLSGIALASVVPSQDETWLQALNQVFTVKTEVLDWQNCAGLKLSYEIPRQIGADRLANVLGARALGYNEGVVIDLGTATTFDVFKEHAYLGGIICPGVQSAMRILANSTAKLAEAELRWPTTFVGKTTDDAMRIGVLEGTIGMVEHLLKGVLKETGLKKPIIIATGGLATWLEGRCKSLNLVEPDLTLRGLLALLLSQKASTPSKSKNSRKH